MIPETEAQARRRVAGYRTGRDLGATLRARRMELDLTQRDVEHATDARGLRITAAALCRIELGARYPTLKTLEVLAGVYRIRLIIEPSITRIERIGPVLKNR